MKGWSFGIVKYNKSVEDIKHIISKYVDSSIWNPAGTAISVGEITPLNKQFVPADSFLEIALNKVIKNNFNNGSYLLELCDLSKKNLTFLLDDSTVLQELSRKLSDYIPINIASVSDRLGHIIFQFPITILMALFSCSKYDEINLDIAWHPEAKKRFLSASLESIHDEVIQNYVSLDIVEGSNKFTSYDFSGGFRGRVWDKENQLLLYASAECSFVKMLNFQMSMKDHEPRQFILEGKKINIQLSGADLPSQVGHEDTVDLHRKLIKKRLFRDELFNISRNKEFVQYGKSGSKHAEHNRAIQDLRKLIEKYGKKGVWLWDPYLSSNDVLKTLFFCSHSNSDLRALSGGLSPFKELEDDAGWGETQRKVLHDNCGNKRRLNLEFRYRNGAAGWAFHDRFIVFPMDSDETALAWSLGTSVNSMGYQHHTLQKVLDGELIKHSFEELWNQLDEERHLLWKS
ncbi:VPA1262 family N-terminal domain-containing protein [Vibrio vulnificus]|uniref:VPA1262 family N-terminal domain-containing protein n=1 Tax=Vibrio vulnificus TaxID=672 RepID=UPI0010D5C79D|nr:VPA1262 family N-terminal domain-containing protein [Vibrio vulnificus]RZR42782.1 hypothetical protein D8T58_18380 [Vibrio vulnificus]